MSDMPCSNPKKARKTFSDAVNKYLADKGMTQADLMARGNLSKTTVGRICRNTNDKGRDKENKKIPYTPTHRMVMTVCVALGLSKAEKDEMMRIAFPEEEVWDEILEKRMNLIDANMYLKERNLHELGSVDPK